MASKSAFVGYAGLLTTKTESLVKYTAKGQIFRNLRHISKTLKGLKTTGRFLGYTGVALSVVEDYQNDNLGAGTVFKAGIGVACTVFPVFGLCYAITDVAVGAITGTTLTDRIANGIDNTVNKTSE